MRIDEEMHKNTQYRIPRLLEQVKEQRDRIGSFVVDCNEDNWDSYNAEAITVGTIKYSVEVLHEVRAWLKSNIGFLNNRTIEFWAAPLPDGDIHIEINYDDMFEIDLMVKWDEPINCFAHPKCRFTLDGTKTIADRDFKMVHAKDQINKNLGLKDIFEFLNEVFYVHKWKFENEKVL